MYLGMFLIAFASLALEVTLVRLLSVVTWYHLAFFAISTAMLGMTAGATTVYLWPRGFEPGKLRAQLGRMCLFFALIIPCSLCLLCLLPLSLRPTVMSLVALLAATIACAFPFFFTGIVVSAVLTKSQLPIGRLYACDLGGASLGCLFVLAGLEFLDAPSLIILCSSAGALAGLCFLRKAASARASRAAVILTLLLAVAAVINTITPYGIRPFFVKDRIESPDQYELEKWNSFSRVNVYKQKKGAPSYWGPSPLAPKDPIEQYVMRIDGEAGTVMVKYETKKDLGYLKYDVTNVGYALEKRPCLCDWGWRGPGHPECHSLRSRAHCGHRY